MAGAPSKRGVVQTETSRRMRYAMYGALFGAVFVVVGTLVHVFGSGAELTLETIARAQREPVMWVLDFAPAVATVVGLVAGDIRDQLSVQNAMVAAAHHDLRVATRALEETTQQSHRRQAALDRAKSDLDRFAHVAAHDLRAPLHAINSLAEWVEEDIGRHLTPDGHEHLKLLRLRAHRMSTLLNSLQAYTLAAREMGDVEPVDVKVLAHQVLRQVPGGSRFIMSFDGDDEPLHTSRAWLSTVLSMLLDNCVRHHDMAPGRIFIEKRDTGAFVELVVADDGPGIADAFRDRVFGLFVTLERRDDHDTTGAGLAVAKRVVESLGGEIEILRRDGRGMRVRFTWPKAHTAEVESADALAKLSLKALSVKKDGPASQRRPKKG